MSTARDQFDLKPDPRILPMLGEINLPQWRCLAELIDNAIDGFLLLARAGHTLEVPEVIVNVPYRDDPSSMVTVADNGPGMTPDQLEKAVRAGWSGTTAIDSLGMFGMGFNIATARLGTVTTVWTSQAGATEEHGLRIDFRELRKQGHFRTPHLTRPKADARTSGTSVTVEQLKPEQRAWFAKGVNRSRIKKELARAYSTMLRDNGVPISFGLVFNSTRVTPFVHCVWDDDRSVETVRYGTVFAVQKIDTRLPDRPFCLACWQWLGAANAACPACGTMERVVKRRRHVHGWIGLQRYLSVTNFGIDFIRNGRKIEVADRELFNWRDPNDDILHVEYPIDDPRQRGRFVGEIHLDHCRVTYMKDRFDRTDPAWDEMVRIVRGDGPLQPKKAADLGCGENQSPLFKLYQVFRRSTPKAKGSWESVLAVKDNDEAERMAKRFHEGDPEYATDEKWWALAHEEDLRALTRDSGAGGGGSGGGISGFGPDDEEESEGGEGAADGPAGPCERPTAPPRSRIASLSRVYFHQATGLRWEVVAYAVEPGDPGLPAAGCPWVLRRIAATGADEALFNLSHPVFRSATMTERDALLSELAHRAADFTRDRPEGIPFSVFLADLRDEYAGPTKLDPVVMASSADLCFRGIARAWCGGVDADDANELFASLPTTDREAIQLKMAARGVPNPQEIVANARFLEFAAPRVIIDFVLGHPELFFDGRCWEEPYTDLNYGSPVATEEARSRVMRHYEALLRDAQWLCDIQADDFAYMPRERALRALFALELLAPTGESTDG